MLPFLERTGRGLRELRTGQEQINSALRGNVMYRWSISKDSRALGSSHGSANSSIVQGPPSLCL